MKRHFKTLVMVTACMAVALCASCKKEEGNDSMCDGVGIFGNYSGIIDGHEYVDLGLTSGTLWATCNVGADSPKDYGNYYAWGETITKSTFEWRTYRFCKQSQNSLTKYNTNLIYGNIVDDKTVLDSVDDVAHAIWGGCWRMPTEKEMTELKEECNWTWQGNYYLVIGHNDNSIILPAAGYRFGNILNSRDSHGFYWTSSLYSPISNNAYSMYFHSVSVKPEGVYPRFWGCTVRPVCRPE